MSGQRLSIIIVANDPLLRAGLSSILQQQNLNIIGEFTSLEQLSTFLADAVIWDGSGEYPEDASLPVLALIPEDTPANRFPNVQGILYRHSSPERIAHALYSLADGLVVFEPAFVTRQTQAGSEAPTDLTTREVEVLNLLAEGLANKAIAKKLDISENTVKFHVNALLSKFDVDSRTEVVIRAIQWGLVTI